jgi:uncharacterized SAM-binding protein YcdF (DUF218 family)
MMRKPRADLTENGRLKDAWSSALLGAGIGLFATTLDVQTLFSIWTAQAWIILFCAAAGGVCGALFRNGRRFLLAALTGMGVLYAVAAWSPLSNLLARGLSRSDASNGAADAVYVFNSQVYPHGVLGDVALSRLVRGLELVKAGRAPRLVFSDMGAANPKFSEAAAKFMDGLGIKNETILVGPVRNTHDEALAVAALFKSRGWTNVVAVTSRTHSRRACAALEAQGLQVVCSPSDENAYDFESLSRPDDRVAAFGFSIHERLGLWVYRRRGWIR